MAVLQLWLLTLLFVVSTKSSNIYSNTIVLDSKGYFNVSYKYNASSDKVEFCLSVNTTGWVGFGFAQDKAPNTMMYYDVAVGAVSSNGTAYLKDYLTVGRVLPRLDTQQDWMLTNSSEENGTTTFKFYRQRNTTDQQNDTAIPIGMYVPVVWAYHPSSDELQHHGSAYRGYMNVTLIPAMTMMTTTPTPTIAAPATSSVVTPVSYSQQVTVVPSIAPTTTTAAPTSATASVVMPMPPPAHLSNFRSLNNGKYNFSWMYNSSMDTIHIMVVVKATGYVAFALATVAPNTMNGYDAAIGKVENGAGDLKDYITVGRTTPQLDSNQDWKLTYSKEENGVTTFRFYRKRDTNDQQDVAIPSGKSIFVIWAYDPTSDQLRHHGQSNRGFEQIILIPAITPTTMMTTMMTTTITAPTPTTKITQFTDCFDDNKFCSLWTFDDQKDTVKFHVKVKTTGWVAFGFALTAPNNMMDYDAFVGGYSNGQGYWNDYYTEGRVQPLPDDKNDYKMLSASEVGGYTELMFERPRDTKDSKDVTFKVEGKLYLIWAYGTDDRRSDRDFDRHVSRGVSEEQVVIVGKPPTPTKAAASSLHSRIYGIVTFAIVFFGVLAM